MANINPRVAGEKPKMRKKVLDEISVKRSANGGFIARHRFDNSGPGEGYHEPEEHTFGEGEGNKMLDHLREHLGIAGKGKKGAAAASPDADGDDDGDIANC